MSLSTKSTRIVLAAAAGALALVTACSSSKTATPAGAGGTSPGAASSSSSSGTVAISLSNGLIVGPSGKTLYYNTLDTASKITCTGGCAAVWLPVTGTPAAGAGLGSSNFTTTSRPDGSTQVLYSGHPLYVFSGDSAPGDKKGDGIADSGGKWIAATPMQASNTGSSAPTTMAPSTSSGYSY